MNNTNDILQLIKKAIIEVKLREFFGEEIHPIITNFN